MKKLLALILALILSCSVAFAAVPDISGCTDAELQQLIDLARNRLYVNALKIEKDAVLVDRDGILLYMTGEYHTWGSSNVYLTINCVLVNNNKFEVSVGFETSSINGWEVYGSGTGSCEAGKKKKVELEFELTDADIKTVEEIEDITFSLYTYNSTDWKTMSKLPEQVFTQDSFKK